MKDIECKRKVISAFIKMTNFDETKAYPHSKK